MLEMLGDGETFGMVLRAKGILEGTDGAWYYFDMVPERRRSAPERQTIPAASV